MGYWKQVLVRATSDAWQQVIASPLSGLAVAALAVLVTLFFYKRIAGVAAMKDQINWLVSAVLPTAVVYLVMFAVNFLLITPSRLYKEKAEEAQKAREALTANMSAAEANRP